jgi:energy-coupling factor transport system ATP-binding protein
MRLFLNDLVFSREGFILRADGVFGEGVHLVTGPVGSGKSTLALAIAGINQPERGEIRREGIGTMMFGMQCPAHQMTATSILEEAHSWGIDPAGLLSSCGLSQREGSDPATLSAGELRRLQLACIFSRDHDLLILDEPFSSLDCVQKERTARKIGSQPGIVILFTHELYHLPRIDCLWEITGGTLVRRGMPPLAFRDWESAPAYLKKMICRGVIPRNLNREEIAEAICRIRG